MKRIISISLSVVMLLSIMLVGGNAFAAGYVSDDTARSQLSLINDFRTGSDAWYWNKGNTQKVYQKNLAKYKYDKNLEKIAKIRVKELTQSFSHTRPDGSDWYTCTTKDANGQVVESDAENILMANNYSAEDAYLYWREDNNKYDGQDHRRNMLSSESVCVGIAGYTADDGTTYWVQEFSTIYSAQGDDDSASNAKPAAPTLKPLVAKSKSFKASWSKVTKNAEGYQLQYATDKKFKKSKKTVTIKGTKTTSKTVKKLKKNKKYFVRVRAYKTVNGKKVCSKWSNKRNVKTK